MIKFGFQKLKRKMQNNFYMSDSAIRLILFILFRSVYHDPFRQVVSQY